MKKGIVVFLAMLLTVGAGVLLPLLTLLPRIYLPYEHIADYGRAALTSLVSH
jgi:hypothetical protein